MIKGAGHPFIPFVVIIAVLLCFTGCGIENKVDGSAMRVQPVATDEHANNGQEDKNIQRILPAPGTVKSKIARRFHKLFGDNFFNNALSSQNVVLDPTGVWVLDEEDGLRLCDITLLASSGRQVLHAPDCYGFIERVISWSLFGPELQLLNEENTVLARLRWQEKASIWIGNSVVEGAVLKMSHY